MFVLSCACNQKHPIIMPCSKSNDSFIAHFVLTSRPYLCKNSRPREFRTVNNANSGLI